MLSLLFAPFVIRILVLIKSKS